MLTDPPPNRAVDRMGWVGPPRMAANPASSPERDQMISETRRTGRPARPAASEFSAMARLASPRLVRRRNRLRATRITGAVNRMSR